MDRAYILNRPSPVLFSVVALAERGSVIINCFILDEAASVVSSTLFEWVMKAGKPVGLRQTDLTLLEKTSFWLLVKQQMLLQ